MLTRAEDAGEAYANPAAGFRNSVVDLSVVGFSVVDLSAAEFSVVDLSAAGQHAGAQRRGAARVRGGVARHGPSRREAGGAVPREAGARAGAVQGTALDTVPGGMRGEIIAASEPSPVLFGWKPISRRGHTIRRSSSYRARLITTGAGCIM